MTYVLKGLPVCRGLALGRVRRVGDRVYGLSIRRGDVLVSRFPLLALAPLLRRAAALVCGYGGRTAGLFVMARTFGIPVVLGIGSQLEQIAEGDLVWVNGSSGMISTCGPRRSDPLQDVAQASPHMP